MRVFLEPTGLHSRAMVRVARALELHAPNGVEVVGKNQPCDLEILHVISADAIPFIDLRARRGRSFAMIQYCLKTAGGDADQWQSCWRQSKLVWSYYDLDQDGIESSRCYYAPLGIDPSFIDLHYRNYPRECVLTTGYVSGPGAEALQETWLAAGITRRKAVHVGSLTLRNLVSRTDRFSCRFYENISDAELNRLYSTSLWVSSLRHIEGFELPAAEGLACGARPILFDQPDLRHWYRDHAIYVPECHGPELVDRLVEIMSSEPAPVTDAERQEVLFSFNWQHIATGFWDALMETVG